MKLTNEQWAAMQSFSTIVRCTSMLRDLPGRIFEEEPRLEKIQLELWEIASAQFSKYRDILPD